MNQGFKKTINDDICQLSFVNTISNYENSLEKELDSFSKEEILNMIKDLASTKKIDTISAYVTVIKKYKKWCLNNKIFCAYGNITKSDYKNFDYKDYYILNDDIIDNLTMYNNLDSSHFIVAGVIRIFWETKADVNLEEILSLNLSQINFKGKILRFKNVDYKVSEWIIEFLEKYINLEKVSFINKNGEYRILKAQDNLGIVFRKAKTKNFKIGCPISKEEFKTLLVKFSNRYSEQSISWSDLLVSMAIMDMYKNFKVPLDIVNDDKYLNLCDSRCKGTTKYKRLFNLSKDLYKEEYKKYLEHFCNL